MWSIQKSTWVDPVRPLVTWNQGLNWQSKWRHGSSGGPDDPTWCSMQREDKIHPGWPLLLYYGMKLIVDQSQLWRTNDLSNKGKSDGNQLSDTRGQTMGKQQLEAKVIPWMGMDIFCCHFHLIVDLFCYPVIYHHLMKKLTFCSHFLATEPS